MRQIVLDTETTGLEASQGHRIIEIGCVEIVNRRITERRYQQYINPQREIDAGAVEVHGITLADLAERPTFADIAMEFVEFVRGAQLIIHNASFDVGFLNMELGLLGPAWGRTEDYCTVFDTLPLAREMHPGQRNSLDALCKRYDVSNAHRERHGALLDAELLAEVYLAMTGGQATLALDAGRKHDRPGGAQARPVQRPSSLTVVMPNAEELAAHEHALKAVDKASRGQCLWMKS
ncbi:MAG: DNA polymerase III subunit epsilon [Gammaproteobacteria bacterium]|nr:DNA polymerase III subunit epsilon [Gammaproteobacteria bacterium]